jgi:hypothetical protein
MTNTIAVFQISTEEDLRFQLDFTGLNLTGRTLKVNVRERSSNTLKVALVAPTYMTLVGAGNLTVFYPKASMASWAVGEYEADVVDETGGSFTRIMAVRFVYNQPGRLVYGVRGNQATVNWGGNQAVVTAIGGVGPPGPVNVLTIGTVETLDTGEPATAEITGDAPVQELNLGLPRGNTGAAATIAVGDVTTGAPGSSASVTNSGTSGAAVFDFIIPRGDVGDQGIQGQKGWSPELAAVVDGARRVHQVVDWAGGEGTKPAVGDYVGATGLVPDIADAVDIRGAPGASVGPGSIGTPELADGAVTFAKVASAAIANQAANEAGASGVLLTTPLGVAQHVDARIGIADGDIVVVQTGGKLPALDGSDLTGVSPDGAILWTGAQTLTDPQKLQARQNAGISPDGDVLAVAASAAAQRTHLGQKWVTVYDQTVAGSAVAAIDIPLTGGYTLYRLTADIVPNSAVSDFSTLFRISKDGGATYLAGASDYLYWGGVDSGVYSGIAQSLNSFGYLGWLMDTGLVAVGGNVVVGIRQGSAGKRFTTLSRSTTFDGINGCLASFGCLAAATGAATHLRIFTSVGGNAYDVGTRIIVEGG